MAGLHPPPHPDSLVTEHGGPEVGWSLGGGNMLLGDRGGGGGCGWVCRLAPSGEAPAGWGEAAK